MITANIFHAPAGKAKYVGQIFLDQNSELKTAPSASSTTSVKGRPFDNTVETIVLLDVSGSMGQNVNRIVSDYLPTALAQVNFNDKIKIVTFTDNAALYEMTIQQLKASRLGPQGGTYMSRGIAKMREIIYPSHSKKFRLIALSDGELHDQDQTVQHANELSALLQSKQAVVSSTALRLYTSSAHPDTRGLSSLMKCGTQSQKSDIIDLKASERGAIIDALIGCFEDNLGSTSLLTCDSAILLQSPWAEPTKEIYITEGQNTFWVTDMSTDTVLKVKQEDKFVGINSEFGNKLDFTSYNTILKDKVEYFMKRLRILKVVNTDDAKNEIEMIVQYFTQLEKCFSMSDPSTTDLLSNHKLHSRLAFFREVAKKKNRSVAIQMSELANDDRVSQLNSAQQADYLRSTSTSTNARSLAKRAIGQGLNFNEVAHKEVVEMKKHLSEIENIDDESHYVSFYSQESTLQGIKTVCELSDDELQQMSAIDILQLINIVGIPCRGPVGDFPDPKTYHLTEIMLGSFVSMSDVMVVKDSGNILRDPYATDENDVKKEILNVVPFYDDDRIQQFLMKYAPTLLEYTASIGMRNMILNVPHTYKYTIVGGVWNMIQRLDTEKTKVNVDVFCKLVRTYSTAVDGIFDHVVGLFKEQTEEEKNGALSFFIQNNGTTNMISPFITVMEEAHTHGGNGEKAKYVPDALSALYSFEFYQSTRKIHKSDSDKLDKRQALLNDLLGIDFSRFSTPIPKHFEPALPNSALRHHNTPDINKKMFNDLCSRVFWVDKIASIPEFILNSFKGLDGQKAIMDMPTLTKEYIEKTVGINFEIPDWCPKSFERLDVFKFYCLVQSFLFDTKADRVSAKGPNGEQAVMKIQDCRNAKAMGKMLDDYIEKQYRARYQSDLDKKEKEERLMLAEELVQLMVSCKNADEFANLFKGGLQRGHVSVRIYDTNQLGYALLKTKLFDSQVDVPLRKEKLVMLVMATRSLDNSDVIWNKGNVLRTSLIELNEGFSRVGLSDYWVHDMFPIYKGKNVYLYRDCDSPNRHSHCNSKASFWAYGYSTVGKYFADISESERQEYLKVHTHCCGIWDGVLVKPA